MAHNQKLQFSRYLDKLVDMEYLERLEGVLYKDYLQEMGITDSEYRRHELTVLKKYVACRDVL